VKILVISNLYPPYFLGGYEIGCRNIVEGLRERGHEVYVLTSPSHVYEEPESSNSKSSHIFRALQLKAFQPLDNFHENVRSMAHFEAMVSNFTNTSLVLETIKEITPDCIYLFNIVGIGGLSILDSLNCLNYPWILHLMDRVPVALQEQIPRSILSIFNAQDGAIYDNGKLISMTKHLVQEIESICGFQLKKPIELIPGWVKIEKKIYQRDYCLSGDVKFVSAGSLSTHKGTDIILEAISILKSKGINGFKVDLYGEGYV
jgi:glycosyltransferase involved in cell wall biosynthesis